jgi:hypothetical protein
MSVKGRREAATLGLSLGWRVSIDAKCVNVGLKQVAEGIINYTMSLHPVQAGERL